MALTSMKDERPATANRDGSGETTGIEEKVTSTAEHVEVSKPSDLNVKYEDVDEEPSLHARTYIALAAMFLLNMTMLVALMGPPTFLSTIGADLNGVGSEAWIPNALGLVQGVLGPLISTTSDLFQARKTFLVGSTLVSFIGSAVAPRAGNIYQVIGAQALIGVGFAAVPLAYCVPSEIVPRKWRPMTQAAMNTAACIGAVIAPVIMGAFLQVDRRSGWRSFYWVQMGLWGVTSLGIFIGYRPPKRHTRLDHLSVWQKIGQIDLLGCALLTVGLTVFLTGLNLAAGLYAWTNARVIVTVVVGGLTLLAFGVYEWRGTKTGIFHHEIFTGPNGAGRTSAISMFLIGVEGFVASSYYIFYPIQVEALFTTVPLKVVARQEAFWIGCTVSGLIFGYASTKFKTCESRWPRDSCFSPAGFIGLATVQPGQSTNAVVFVTMAGIGFGAVLILVVSGVQLCTPHKLIATCTAVVTTTRAVVGSVATAVFFAVFRTRLAQELPAYVAKAALSSGLPAKSLPAFLEAFLRNDSAALANTAGVTPSVIAASAVALKQAYADSVRVPFIIAAPFAAVAVIACYFLADLGHLMNYGVDAPVEVLHAKHQHEHRGAEAA